MSRWFALAWCAPPSLESLSSLYSSVTFGCRLFSRVCCPCSQKNNVLRQKKKKKPCRVLLNVIICSHQAARQCMFLHSCTNGHLNGGVCTCFVPFYKFGVDFHVFPRDPSPSDLHNTSSGFVPLEVKTLQLMLKFFLLCLGLFSPFKRLSPSESAVLQLDGWSDSQSFHLLRSTCARPRSPPARSGSGSADTEARRDVSGSLFVCFFFQRRHTAR